MAKPFGNAKVIGMSNPPTRTYLLLEERIGEPLNGYVRNLRTEGKSWNAVALALYDATGIPVTSQTLRNWFPIAKESAAA